MNEKDWNSDDAEFWYYKNLYEKTFGKFPSFHFDEGDAVGKMKKAIETGEEYDLDKDPDYVNIPPEILI